jgi:hypothetical protein
VHGYNRSKNYDWLPGNWGTSLPETARQLRYIEARLSKFALEVIYSPKLLIGDVLWW